MSFTLKNNPSQFNYVIGTDVVLERPSVQRDLGVLFDAKCSFNAHILAVRTKCHNIISVLSYSFRNLKSRSAYLNLYNAMVLSRLSYCSVVWCGSAEYLISFLQSVQTRFLRFMNWRLSLPKEFSATEL